MAVLDTIADHQSGWSVTANSLKARIDRARRTVFGFSVLGALLAAIASQWTNPAGTALSTWNDPRTWIALCGALSLAIATFFTQRLLGKEHVVAWVRARAISEALKCEAYKYTAGASPYDRADRDAKLDGERQKIEEDGDDLLTDYVRNAGRGSVPREMLSHDEYVARRLDGQIAWYRKTGGKLQQTAKLLRRVEFWLALAATLITAIASVTGKHTAVHGYVFDVAALTAVLTTVAGAVLAHAEASRFDYLVTAYFSTANRLENLKPTASGDWNDFVEKCEAVLATENTAWIAKWTKPKTP
jgi:SMODS and SLOG-associating 2TM effector domain 1/Protein of unknown function (DUF4231)